MDRDALVLRNRSMAEAFHTMPFKHYLRRAMLHTLARVPILQTRRANPNRILLIRPDHLGDVLLTTPAIHALRAAYPRAELHALVGPWSASVLAPYPEIDVVLTLPFPGFNRRPKENWNWRSPYQLAWDAARNLRRIGYGSAIIFRPDHWWGAMLTYLAGIPERIGYDMTDVAPFLTQTSAHQHTHAVAQNLKLVERWTGKIAPQDAQYHFPTDHVDQGYIDGYLEEWDIPRSRALIGIHPGTGTWVKHWQEEKWALVADTLSEQLNATVVFTGSENEIHMVKRIAARMKHPHAIIAGDTQVGQLAALFARARVVLGPDSGPLHLAAAVGTPTVVLYGPADPVEFGPWNSNPGSPDKHIVVTASMGCRPCRVLDWADDDPAYHPCMRDITIAQVLEAARRAANHAPVR